jgi:beta-N-acetylhexosaminidase
VPSIVLKLIPIKITRRIFSKLKPGSFLVAGFSGLTAPPLLEKLILEEDLGGVILFSRNMKSPEQVQELCVRLQHLKSKVSSIPLLIAVDQEGGFVTRFPEGIKPIPCAWAQKKGGRIEWTRELYEITGQRLKNLGINCNFAPVLDVVRENTPSIIGIRSFSSDPDKVAKFGLAAVTGTHTAGILSCGKHYPGLGRALLDPHQKLPVIPASKRSLLDNDLVPFKKIIPKGLYLLMTSHACYPAFGDKSLPATFSSKINSDLLRKRLHYNGVLICDDLEMGAIAALWPLEEAAILALCSGADMLMICHNLDKVPAVIRAVKKGLQGNTLPKIQMLQSRIRINRMFHFLQTIRHSAQVSLPNSRKKFLCKEIASRSFTVLKKDSVFFSSSLSTAVFLFIQWLPKQAEEKEPMAKDSIDRLKALFKKLSVFFNPDGPLPRDYKKFDQIFLITNDFTNDPGQKKWLLDLRAHNRKIDLAACIKNPFDRKALAPHCRNLVATFGFLPENQLALLQFIEKKTTPT